MSVKDPPIEEPGKYSAVYRLDTADGIDRLGATRYRFTRPYGGCEIHCQGFEFHPGPNRGVELEPGKKYRITIEEVSDAG